MASSAVASKDSTDVWKEREEQQKRAAGKAAPEIDVESGKMINPHNPSFITNAPWYLAQEGSSLKHQKAWKKQQQGSLAWYQRGTKGDVKTKFAKGACANCGAMTHTAKECTERPRAKLAKHTGEDLAPDEYIQDLEFDYDMKRDRWNGFSPDDFKREVIDVHEAREQVKQKRKEQELARKQQERKMKKLRKQNQKRNQKKADSDVDSDSDSDADSDGSESGEKLKGFENEGTMGSKDNRARTTTRNLRIREDTAKYLMNLDVNSAYYDPKSRSMRANPREGFPEEEQHNYRGDNFIRQTGDSNEVVDRQIFAWEAYKHGNESVHAQAAPTQAARLHEEFMKRKEALKNKKKNELLDKYGGEEHLEVNPLLLHAQTEDYKEYARSGRVIEERKRMLAVSKYEEDIFEGDHTSVWGSYFCIETQRWGYKCCQQVSRGANCVPLITKVVPALTGKETASDLLNSSNKKDPGSAQALQRKSDVSAAENEDKTVVNMLNIVPASKLKKAEQASAPPTSPKIGEKSSSEPAEKENEEPGKLALNKSKNEDNQIDSKQKESSEVKDSMALEKTNENNHDGVALQEEPKNPSDIREDKEKEIVSKTDTSFAESTENKGEDEIHKSADKKAKIKKKGADDKNKKPATKKRKRKVSTSSSSSSSSSDGSSSSSSSSSDDGSSSSDSDSSSSSDSSVKKSRKRKASSSKKKKASTKRGKKKDEGTENLLVPKMEKTGRKGGKKKDKKDAIGESEDKQSQPKKKLKAEMGIQSGSHFDEKEFEKYQKDRIRADDPMAALM